MWMLRDEEALLLRSDPSTSPAPKEDLMSNDKRKEDMKYAFERAHGREPTPKEEARLGKAVDDYAAGRSRFGVGRKKKS